MVDKLFAKMSLELGWEIFKDHQRAALFAENSLGAVSWIVPVHCHRAG